MPITPQRPGRNVGSILFRALRSSLLALCLASCAAEGKPGLPSDIEWRSEHFVYHARAEDADVCPALLERMERHFDVIAEAVGLPWPEGRVIHYYKFLDADDYAAAAGCPEETGGCVRGGDAYSYTALHEHELIHTYFAPLGSPPRLLSEGVADLLSCDMLGLMTAAMAEESVSNAAEIEFYNLRDVPYVMGSILVNHLVETYGWEAFVDLYGEDWQRRDDAEIERNFQATYAASFDGIWASATQAAPMKSCVAAWACSADPLSPGVAETPGDYCGDSIFRTVTPSEPGLQEFETDGAPAMLFACPDDPGQPISGPFGLLETSTVADLVGGDYFVATAGDTTLTSTRLDASMLGTECAELDTLALDAPDAGVSWLIEPRTSPYFLRLELPTDATLSVSTEGVGPFQICPACDVSDECVSVEQAGTFAARSGAALHFPASPEPGHLARLNLYVD